MEKLHYVEDGAPGFGRASYRGKFRYLDSHGRPLTHPEHLARIQALRIPPAWVSVWICPHALGHLQATGRDAKGRKQYIYHAEWRKRREAKKYAHMLTFGQQLPGLRKQVALDMAAPGLGKQKVLATMVYLLENTLIRIGNDAYARVNQSFGLSTLRNRHVQVCGTEILFHFRGKSGVEHAVSLRDRRLARLVRHMRELPGQALFQYVDAEGQRHPIGSGDVNAYLQQVMGSDFTAKDFRTWFGSLHTLLELSVCAPFASAAEAKKNVLAAIRCAAAKLGNTPAICRNSYVHPCILEGYLSGKRLKPLTHVMDSASPGLSQAEQCMLSLLRKAAKNGR